MILVFELLEFLMLKVLKVYTFPATLTAFQFGCGTVVILLMWGLNLHPKPKVNRSQVKLRVLDYIINIQTRDMNVVVVDYGNVLFQFTQICLLAVGHTIGNLLTNISLGKVAVSFTHTIKAMEPFFTVLLSALFFGEV